MYSKVLNRLKQTSYSWKSWLKAIALLACAYTSICFFLAVRQCYFIYRPKPELSMLPSASAFNLPYEDVWISTQNSDEKIHGWWIPSSPENPFQFVSDEPINILASPKVMVYFCGVGRNMGDYNYLARAAAFRQLGFSVLVFDYRGYGHSEGSFPSESQLYEDSEAVWNYLRDQRNIPADQILIYGESLGGAIALNLATKHPEAAGLIMQSSFTSMAEAIRHRRPLQLFPINWVLTEHFNSISKIQDLKIPVLFLHGTEDSVVPFQMSQQLYEAAPGFKQLFLIEGGDHVRIYEPGEQSYLKAIASFVAALDSSEPVETKTP